MFSIRSILVLFATSLSVLAVACSSGDLAVGKSDQQLQTRKDGQPTGNGQTCSWAGTSQWDAAGPALPPEASEVYALGDSFKSLDRCNDCDCTANGIMCTIRSCEGNGAPAAVCSLDTKQCPDGSFVGRSGPNCELGPCPSASSSCDQLANAAAKVVLQAIDDHQSCTVDADCTIVWRSADCFDQCAGVAGTSGPAAVDAAKAQVNAAQCKEFKDLGCVLISPPCDPPSVARCVSNACVSAP